MERKIIFLSAFVFIGFFGGAEISLAADYYVSPTGAASWQNCGAPAKNGSAACSWQTAMANVTAGDTVYFRGGNYDPGEANRFGDPKIRPANDGTAQNPIILKAYPGETPVIYDALVSGAAPPANNTGTAAGCYQNSYVTWDGFTFNRANNNGYQASAIMRFELSDHCTVTNSDFIGRPQLDQYNGSLIHIVQSRYISINNNKLHGMSCGVVPASTCVNSTAVWSFDFDHVDIFNNDIYDNNNCLSSKIGTSYLNIYRNHMWNCPRTAVNYIPQVEGTTDASIFQNVIRNSGPALYSPDAFRPFYNLKFYNNTVYNSSVGALATIGNGTYTNSRAAEIFNNIISVGGSGSIFERFGSGVDKPAYADYNDFFGSGDWRVAYSAVYNTLAGWRAAMNLDLNSITSNPLFINPGGSNPEDYKLQAGSPARIGRGGAHASVMGAYISGDETIGYRTPPVASPPAPSTYFQENFEAVPISSLPWSCGGNEPANVFFDASYSLCYLGASSVSAQIISGEGLGGSVGGRFNYHPGGTFDGAMSNPGPTAGYNEVYVRSYIRFQPNFPWGTADGVKLFRWYFGSKSVIPVLNTNTAPWDGKHRATLTVSGAYPPGIGNGWALEDHNDGAWHLFEIRMKLNTPGVADGIIEWWIDGQNIFSINNWLGREAGDNSLLMTGGVGVGGNIAGGPASTASVWYDNFSVKNYYTGLDAAASDTTAPAAPSGLSVF